MADPQQIQEPTITISVLAIDDLDAVDELMKPLQQHTWLSSTRRPRRLSSKGRRTGSQDSGRSTHRLPHVRSQS